MLHKLRGVGSSVSVMNRIRAYIAFLLSFLVTSYEFTEAALEFCVCRFFRIRLPYETIRFCGPILSHRRIVIPGHCDEEKQVKRVILWGTGGTAVVLCVSEFESFLTQLRNRAPHAVIRALKTRTSTITADRKRGFPWLIFTLRREKFDGNEHAD